MASHLERQAAGSERRPGHLAGALRATRRLGVVFAAIALARLALPSPPVLAQSACQLTGGFAQLQAQITDRVGSCQGNAVSRPELGELTQRTTTGLLA